MSDTLARETGSGLYEQFARVGKAVASARRVELLDLLCQGERSVDALARTTGMTVTNTSQHLQVLLAAGLVGTRKAGTRVFYRVADDDVCRFFVGLCETAAARLAEIERLVRAYADGDGFEKVTRRELLHRMEQGDVVVLDVRPQEEFAAGHIPGAVSLPLDELRGRLDELPRSLEVVAYCRGPYCLLASQALHVLRAHGYTSHQLEDGFPEWRLAGLPVAVGGES